MQISIGPEYLPDYRETFSNNLTVPAGQIIELSGIQEYDAIHVEGTLKISRSGLTLRYVNLAVAAGGLLDCGTAADPVLGPVEFIKKDVPLDTIIDPYQWGHGIVCVGGKVYVHGNPVATPWIRLSAPLLTGQTVIHTTSPTGWSVGDEVAVPATVFATGKLYEIFTIAAIDGTQITLNSPTTFDRPGAVDYDLVTPTVVNGEPLNAHVCNLTRNIVFRSENPNGTRGHFVGTGHCGIDVRYARFQDTGRTNINAINNTTADTEGNITHVGTNQIGKYSVHLHHAHGLDNGPDPEDYPGVPQPQFRVVGNVILGDVKWGMSVHGTHYGLVKNNISHAIGAGIITEDGSESYNVLWKNFAFGNPGNGSTVRYDTEGKRGAGFWLRGNHNYFFGNVAAGAEEGFGFYISNETGNSETANKIVRIPLFPGAHVHTEGEYQNRPINSLPLLGWDDNESYAHRQQGIGMWSIQLLPPELEPVFRNSTIWHCDHRGVFLDYSACKFDGLVIRGFPSPNTKTVGVTGHHMNARTPLTLENYDIQLCASPYREDDRPSDHTIYRNGFSACWGPFEISSRRQGFHPQKHEFENPRFAAPAGGELKTISVTIHPYWIRGSSYIAFIAHPVEVLIRDYQGIAGDDFRVWAVEQAQDYVEQNQASGPIGGGLSFTYSPEPGLSNSEIFAKYSVAPLMELAPAGTETRPEITGIISGSEIEPPPPPPDPDPIPEPEECEELKTQVHELQTQVESLNNRLRQIHELSE